MTKLWGLAGAHLTGAHLVGVLVVVPSCAIAAGVGIVSSLAAPASPAPVIKDSPPRTMLSTDTVTFTFTSTGTPASFQCALDASTYSAYSACTSPQAYNGVAPGQHVFNVEAVYGTKRSAVIGGPTSYGWTAVPPAPSIDSGPAGRSTSADPSPIFTFSDAAAKVMFVCAVDSGAGTTCNSGKARYNNLATGKHCFSVYVTDNKSKIRSATTTNCWTIVASRNFSVGGSLTSPLYPGVSEPLNLTFTNPNPDPLTIKSIPATDIGITVDPAHSGGCKASNFKVAQGLTAQVIIPANRSAPVSLSDLSVPQGNWPVIEMIDKNVDQGSCQGASLTLTYSGIGATG